ncbi:MAG: DUF3800 domain-containing protein [Sphingomonadaceae bacterium]
MLVFIDESGDSGFRLDKGSTAVFAVAMVIFNDHGQAAACDEAIRALQAKLGIKPEFKFSKSSADVRDQFFAAIAPFDFRVRVLVVRKERIHSGHLRSSKEDFYRFFVKSMVKFDNGRLVDARVVIDGSGERTFRRDLQSHLRRHCADGAIKTIAMKASHSDPLVQLADMCVGAVARSYRPDRPDHNRWRRLLRGKIDDVWEFQ